MTPLETVNEFIARLCAKDFDGACELVSDEVEYDNVPMGKHFGREELKATLTPMMGSLDSEWTIHREAATGNIVMNERTDRFIAGEKGYDIPVTGVFELNDDGQIMLWRDYFDMTPVNTMMTDLAG
jgi:limonene-1,2-epoxide hydrolase